MQGQLEKAPSLSFRDDSEEENYSLKKEDCLHNTQEEPSRYLIIAAVSAALLACGLLHEGSVITAIRPVGSTNPWKMAGIIDLMAGRELLRY